MSDNRIIGSRLREAREDRDMTMKELGDAIQKSESTISRYESGISTIHHNTARALAHTLGINPVWLQGYPVPANTWNQPKLSHLCKYLFWGALLADNH